MTEKEFDRKIRNRAMMREDKSSQPLWNKDEVWNRIDSSLRPASGKNRWWPAAAVFLLFLLSAGWSVAQYISNEKYKEEKELEITQLKENIQSVKEDNDLIRTQLNEEITRKDNEIEKLKEEISIQQIQNNSIIESSKTGQQEVVNLENELNERAEMIQSLRAEIAQLKQDETIVPEIVLNEPEDTMTMEVTEPEVDKSSTRIYYINGSQSGGTTQSRNGLKINLFGRGDDHIEYKSEQSIFSK